MKLYFLGGQEHGRIKEEKFAPNEEWFVEKDDSNFIEEGELAHTCALFTYRKRWESEDKALYVDGDVYTKDTPMDIIFNAFIDTFCDDDSKPVAILDYGIHKSLKIIEYNSNGNPKFHKLEKHQERMLERMLERMREQRMREIEERLISTVLYGNPEKPAENTQVVGIDPTKENSKETAIVTYDTVLKNISKMYGIPVNLLGDSRPKKLWKTAMDDRANACKARLDSAILGDEDMTRTFDRHSTIKPVELKIAFTFDGDKPVIDDQGRQRHPVTGVLLDNEDCVTGPISLKDTLRDLN